MAVTITSDNFEQYWLESQAAHGQALEGTGRVEVIDDPTSVANTLTMPGVVYDGDPALSTSNAQRYVQIKYTALSATIAAAQQALDDMEGDKDDLELLVTQLQGQVAEYQAVLATLDGTAADAAALAEKVTQANNLITQLNTAITNAQTATTNANDATTAANTAATTANTAAANAKADYVGNDNYVYRWNSTTGEYERTNIYVKGDPMTWSEMSAADQQALIAQVMAALADGGITTAYLADGAVTWAKLATAVQDTINGKLNEITQEQFNEIFD